MQIHNMYPYICIQHVIKLYFFPPIVPEFTQQPHAFDHDLAGDPGKTRALAVSNSGDMMGSTDDVTNNN